jgi:hypothetical protein
MYGNIGIMKKRLCNKKDFCIYAHSNRLELDEVFLSSNSNFDRNIYLSMPSRMRNVLKQLICKHLGNSINGPTNTSANSTVAVHTLKSINYSNYSNE